MSFRFLKTYSKTRAGNKAFQKCWLNNCDVPGCDALTWTNFLSTSFSTIQSSSSCFNRGSHPASSVHNLLLGKWHITRMLMLEPRFSPKTRLNPGASRLSEGWGRCTKKWPSYFHTTWTQGQDWPTDKDQNVWVVLYININWPHVYIFLLLTEFSSWQL